VQWQLFLDEIERLKCYRSSNTASGPCFGVSMLLAEAKEVDQMGEDLKIFHHSNLETSRLVPTFCLILDNSSRFAF